MVRMTVTYKYRVDLIRSHPFQQPWHGRIADIDEQPEAVMLAEITTARPARLRPGTIRSQNGEPYHGDCNR
jgi:hypothetical protein